MLINIFGGPGRYNFLKSASFHVKRKIVTITGTENFTTNYFSTAYVSTLERLRKM